MSALSRLTASRRRAPCRRSLVSKPVPIALHSLHLKRVIAVLFSENRERFNHLLETSNAAGPSLRVGVRACLRTYLKIRVSHKAERGGDQETHEKNRASFLVPINPNGGKIVNLAIGKRDEDSTRDTTCSCLDCELKRVFQQKVIIQIWNSDISQSLMVVVMRLNARRTWQTSPLNC